MYISLKILFELIEFICQKIIMLMVSLSILLNSLNTISTLYGCCWKVCFEISHSLICQLMQITIYNMLELSIMSQLKHVSPGLSVDLFYWTACKGLFLVMYFLLPVKIKHFIMIQETNLLIYL